MAYSVINPGFYHLGYSFDFPPYHNEEYRDENEIKQLRWKHAVMFNRRAYVGNVEMTSYDGSVETLSDSIFKSRTNKFDSFSKDRRIDVAIGDGEDITALAHFADMLLQFKQTTLHIVNCSGASEFLEGTYKFKGVDNPASVCSTDFGIAWANKHGCFFFDGREVKDLFVKRGLKKIQPATWTAFASSTIRAGFFPNEKQIVFVNDGGDWFVHDLVTNSFVRGTARTDSADKTNLVNAWEGELLIGYGATTLTVKPLKATSNSTTGDSTNLEIITRELDTGTPNVEKKWKKVYVTYRNAGTTKLKIWYKGVSDSGESAWTEITQSGNSSNPSFAPSGSGGWNTTGFPIGATAYTMMIKIVPVTPGTTEVPYNFEINDITFVYRTKVVK
tara:strand:+ start:1434 stop:2597 length:1164 start_codon:yes stop_codon:yes gene_type:complete